MTNADDRLRRLARSRTRRGEEKDALTRRLAGIPDSPRLRLRPLNPTPVEPPTDDTPAADAFLRGLKPKNKKARPAATINVTTPDEEKKT